jgi:hypothetical protein
VNTPEIAALERMVGRQAVEIEFLKGALKSAPRPRSASTPSSPAPWPLHAEGCRLMGLSRSTYYDVPSVPTDDAALVATRPRFAMSSKPMAIAGWVPSCATAA